MKYSKKKIARLKNMANTLRCEVLDMVYNAGSGHIGGSFSLAEIMACIYFNDINIKDGDVVVLSKGHASPILYASLYEKGIISSLESFRDISSDLEGHPTPKIETIPVATGSLGQGLSVAVGIALSKRLDNDNSKVYAIIGDGEMQEGQIWEALLSASKYSLKNLTIIIDANKVQLDGNVSDIMDIYPLSDKLDGFNFDVIEINGHNISEILKALDTKTERTKVIIANTIKGKGVFFMENDASWHGKAPNDEQYKIAKAELKKTKN